MHEEEKNDRWENEYGDLLVFALEQNMLNKKTFFLRFEWLIAMTNIQLVSYLQKFWLLSWYTS